MSKQFNFTISDNKFIKLWYFYGKISGFYNIASINYGYISLHINSLEKLYYIFKWNLISVKIVSNNLWFISIKYKIVATIEKISLFTICGSFILEK